MEMLAGKRNAMLATGGGSTSPSIRNPNIEWIYSTSLTETQVNSVRGRRTDFDKPRIVVACRQEKLKGTDIVIRGFSRILETLPGATLIIAGDGSYLDRLRSIAKDCGVLEKVTFCGKLSQKEVVEVLRSGDVFCFPTSASEGFPKVVVEALSAGLPVVSTRVSVIPQLLESGSGILLESLEPDELADAVIEIFSDREKYDEMSGSALETARSFTLENWRDRIAAFLQRSWGDDPSLRDIGTKSFVRPL
jgi:phosphatidylinositol alpha-1,6-mannosyltransferase